jgi:hypothetical protein
MEMLFTKLLGHKRTKAGIELTFLDDENEMIACLITESVAGGVVDALQRGLLPKSQSQDILTVTVLQSQPLMTPTAKGLALRTLEAGTIAFAVPDDVLPRLRSDLAALESAKAPTRKQ